MSFDGTKNDNSRLNFNKLLFLTVTSKEVNKRDSIV